MLIDGSASIPNRIDGSRNHLDSLLEPENQVEILESEITISAIYFSTVFSHIL